MYMIVGINDCCDLQKMSFLIYNYSSNNSDRKNNCPEGKVPFYKFIFQYLYHRSCQNFGTAVISDDPNRKSD